jgi:hypothetical protein
MEDLMRNEEKNRKRDVLVALPGLGGLTIHRTADLVRQSGHFSLLLSSQFAWLNDRVRLVPTTPCGEWKNQSCEQKRKRQVSDGIHLAG